MEKRMWSKNNCLTYISHAEKAQNGSAEGSQILPHSVTSTALYPCASSQQNNLDLKQHPFFFWRRWYPENIPSDPQDQFWTSTSAQTVTWHLCPPLILKLSDYNVPMKTSASEFSFSFNEIVMITYTCSGRRLNTEKMLLKNIVGSINVKGCGWEFPPAADRSQMHRIERNS